MTQCPHCGQPSHFPNVNAASRNDEITALESRYQSAVVKFYASGDFPRVQQYEAAVTKSEAVINRSLSEVTRLCYSEDQIYATFYQRVGSGMQLSGADSWDRKREIADTILFGDQPKRHVRFAALTLNGEGLPHYGECSLILKEEMIAHRASVFEENAVIFVWKRNLRAKTDFRVPVGFRSTWSDRHKLAVSKVANQPTLEKQAHFAEWLLKPGKTESKDSFIEVHIWGSLTIKSFSMIVVKAWKGCPSTAELEVVKAKCPVYGITVELPD